MKIKILLFSFLLFVGLTGYCTDWTVTNSGFTFSPATLTITVGDRVIFNIAGTHNVLEVSQTTWNANGTAPLSGGFQLPFGGGTLSSSDLPVGTHYYVCQPHASSGMKGRIIVEDNITGVDDIQLDEVFTISPNPFNGKFELKIGESQFMENSKLEIYNIQGKKVFQTAITDPKSIIDLSDFSKGIYLAKVYVDQSVITKKILKL